jgi:hypothetical protein
MPAEADGNSARAFPLLRIERTPDPLVGTLQALGIYAVGFA